MDNKINLEEIWNKYKEFTKGPNLPGMVDLDYFKPIVNIMICEGISQALELAAENALICGYRPNKPDGFIMDSNICEDNQGYYYYIDKQSIIDIIKQIE